MATNISIELDRTLGDIDPNIFGGFAEHLGRHIYGGIFEPESPLADADGLRSDVQAAIRRFRMPAIRYPGGNFVSGYRWRDAVGPVEERKARMELAWHDIEPNTFGTNEFIRFCQKVGSEPYLAVNCGDGDMREARDWVEYCNGTKDTELVKLRKSHGYDEPHGVKYWGIGNEVDGPWQIGMKTPEEYARAYTEFAKVMKWTDPSIKLFASGISFWQPDWTERLQLLVEQAGSLIDYMAIHWYVGNDEERGYGQGFEDYMSLSELINEKLTATEGMLHALRSANKIENPIPIAVDEWNVWYRAMNEQKLEEAYNLEDALVVAMHFNAFIRHASSVKMANIAQIVNVIAPILTSPEGLVLQTTFFPFEVYRNTCGTTALDVHWAGDTFSTKKFPALRTLDVSATLDEANKKLTVYAVNRSESKASDVTITLHDGHFAGPGSTQIVNGPDVKAENTFATPDNVITRKESITAEGSTFDTTLEPHSVTALVFDVA